MKQEVRFFKALADETRLLILWLLMQAEELCVCDIMQVLGITQSKASRHLRYLYHVGLVADRRVGVWMNYRLLFNPRDPRHKVLQLLREMLESDPVAQAVREKLSFRLEAKSQEKPQASLAS